MLWVRLLVMGVEMVTSRVMAKPAHRRA